MKKGAARSNDLHHYRQKSLTPANRIVRNMAELILHERPEKPSTWRVHGEKHGAKRGFSEEEVRALRKKWRGGATIASLAREENVHPGVMNNLLYGYTYGWVGE